MDENSMGWRPATIEDVNAIVAKDLDNCDHEQIAAWRRYSVEPFLAPIERYRNLEFVVVVARKGTEVIYWEDVEEGFNVSAIAGNGRILEHRCNQDELKYAMNAWIEGRKIPGKFGPATLLQ